MKTFKTLMLAFSIPFLCLLSSCEKGDSDIDYGTGYVYISQATLSGGLNNYMTVPSGWGSDTYDFAVIGDKLNVTLTVTRSGKIAEAKGFSVNVNSEPDMARKAVEKGDIESAELLSSSSFSLPSTATVEAGENYGAFYLSVDLAVVNDESNAGKNLVTALSISSPTAYELSDKNTSVVVILNVDTIKQFL